MQGPKKYPMIVEKFANDAEAALRMENWTREKNPLWNMCLLEFTKIKEGSVFYFSRFRKSTYDGPKERNKKKKLAFFDRRSAENFGSKHRP